MESNVLTQFLSRYWWVFLVRGVLAILFGIAAIAWPGLTIATLVLLFAAFAFVDGLFGVVHAISHRREIDHWGLVLLEGFLGIAIGVLAFQAPLTMVVVSETLIACYLAAWGFVTGVTRIVLALRLRKEIEGEWLLILSGTISILFALVVLVRPDVGLVTLVYLAAVWSIVLGVTLMGLAFKVRKIV
jgi:uncharacterized membrane protein HdeD (DUF308 family)